jgi:integrase/recombinase XerD
MRGRPKGGLTAAAAPTSPADECLRGLADQFLFRMAARAYSPGSVEAHGWALKYFIDWAVSRRLLTPAAFTRPLLEEYQLFLHQFRSERTGALLAVNTQLARLGVIRRFFAWLCRENIIPANPAADLDLPRKQARLLPKSLAIEEIDRLLALPDVSSPFGARDRALLELFYATGVRRTEMVRLELGDFDPAQRTLHVRRGKGGKSRLLPVGDRAARWLSHYLAEIRPLLAGHPGERALFLSGYGSPFSPAYLGNWVARQMRKAGIEKKGSCHLFRHSCATHMLEGGADIRYIQQMLGHARLDTTQIYTEVSIRALTEAHARSHPHGRLSVSGEGPVDSNGASGSLSPVPGPPIPPVSVSASGLAATTVSHPTEDPEEPTAMEVDSAKPPTGPAVGTFQGMLEACGWPDGTDGGVIEYGYRYLDTQLGRWLSRDQIGEYGGKNLYAFLQNSGVSKNDFLGNMPVLGIKDNGVALFKCGSFSWETQWAVDPDADKVNGGQILQDVEIWESVNKCDEEEKEMTLKAKLTEAWRVMPGTSHVSGLYRLPEEKWYIEFPKSDNYPDGKKYLGYLDYFNGPYQGKCTHGRTKVTGWARYYPNKGEVDWKTGTEQDLPSGLLPTTLENPKWDKKGASKLVTHSITVKWNCCPKETDERESEIVEKKIS